MSDETWVRLQRGNDRGVLFFVRPDIEGGEGDQANGVDWSPGDRRTVRLSDGNVLSCELIAVCSRSGLITSALPGVRVSDQDVPLDELDVLREEWVAKVEETAEET